MSVGNKKLAKQRLELLESIPQLDVTGKARTLAGKLIKQVPLPKTANVDSLHIAIATVHGMDYLLTWNCTHIANATLRHTIENICRINQYEPPVICTPQELMEVWL